MAALPERRSEPREPCYLPIVVVVDGREVPGMALDASASGACIECAAPLAERDRVRVRLATPARSIVVGAEVRWATRPGDRALAGVRFDGMRAMDMWAWVRFLGKLR
jgi:PilZ domain-containing protein